MLAGPLDRRITIERWGAEIDDFGGEIVEWLHVATVWASAEDIRDSERYRAQQVGSDVTTRFRVRWRYSIEQLNPKDRLHYGGRVFNIVATKGIGRKEGIEITACARSD
jgi:SPP1 family predicted phage head-tail adaptor